MTSAFIERTIVATELRARSRHGVGAIAPPTRPILVLHSQRNYGLFHARSPWLKNRRDSGSLDGNSTFGDGADVFVDQSSAVPDGGQ
jgi:hypothetical protein